MGIHGFYIDGYKSLRNLYVPLRGKFSILVGPNDAGKSAIVEAIEIFYKGFYDGRRIKRLEAGKFFNREVDIICIAAILNKEYSKEKNYAIVVEIKAKEDPRTGSYRDTIDVSISKNIMIYDFSKKTLHELHNPPKINLLDKLLPAPIFLPTSRRLRETYGEREIKESLIRPVIDSILQDKDAMRNLENLKQKLNEELKIKIEELNKSITNYGLNIKFRPDIRLNITKGLDWEFITEEEGMEIPLTEKGEGLQNITMLELYRILSERKQSSKEYLLIIDELENHLYPFLMHRVLSTIIKLTSKNYYALIITHSPIIINNVNPNNILFVYKKGRKTNLIPINSEKDLIKVNRELDVNLSDIIGARVILLVEGKYDKKFIKYLLENEIPPEISYGVHVTDMVGVTKARYYTHVYTSITEKYSGGKVLVLLDGDNNSQTEYNMIINELNDKITKGILIIKILPEKATIEDALHKEEILNIVPNAIKNYLKQKAHLEEEKVKNIVADFQQQFIDKDQERRILDTLGRILGQNLDANMNHIIKEAKDYIKKTIWDHMDNKEQWKLSEIGEDVKTWLTKNLSN